MYEESTGGLIVSTFLVFVQAFAFISFLIIRIKLEVTIVIFSIGREEVEHDFDLLMMTCHMQFCLSCRQTSSERR